MRLIASPLLALPRAWKQTVVIGIDVALCALTIWIAYYLRLGVWLPMNGRPMLAIGLSIALAVPIFAAFGLYRIVFRHAGSDAVVSCAMACCVYGLGYAAVITAYGFELIPRTVGLIQPALLFIGVAGSRAVAGLLLGQQARGRRVRGETNVLIYGAGSTGRQLAEAMATSKEMRIIGFIDDDRSLHDSRIRRLRVYAPDALDTLVKQRQVTDVLLAIPTARRARRMEIVEQLKSIGLRVRTLPGLMDIAHGTFQTSDLRDVTITDLLQRDPVPYDTGALNEHITGNIIMVTGAGGSIGSELSRQIAAMTPRRLLLVEHSEYALYAIHNELCAAGHDEMLVPLLASVTDTSRIDSILGAWRPQMVFHAAAYKHVPLVEHNPLEGLRNNVIGTAIVAELSARHGVRDFVLISTDKAVRPTNIMGASKRLAELVLQGLNQDEAGQHTCFSMVRFGNVLGSSGSVVPLFTRQIRMGGPITITHPDITRYFMTIPEAVQLVLQASAMARGGEVFVLDMGDPVRIRDLASNMIRLSGLTVRDGDNLEGDIEIQAVGLRPGEKLFEELLIGNDPRPTAHPRIMMATEHSRPWSEVREQINDLGEVIAIGDVVRARALLQENVVEFVPNSGIVDWVTMETSTQRSPSAEAVAP